MRILESDARFALEISGADHLDLLHRISSNTVTTLGEGDENLQCFLNARGKIIVPFRFRRGAGKSLIAGPLELKELCRETIEKYIFSEDVRLDFVDDIPAVAYDENQRIRNAELKWGAEVDHDTIPWEANMRDYVSTDKGCYTGQEVIARIETYGDAPRHIRLLSTASPDAIKEELYYNEKEAGAITSITSQTDATNHADTSGLHHALAMLKRAVEPGFNVQGKSGVTWAVLESNQ